MSTGEYLREQWNRIFVSKVRCNLKTVSFSPSFVTYILFPSYDAFWLILLSTLFCSCCWLRFIRFLFINASIGCGSSIEEPQAIASPESDDSYKGARNDSKETKCTASPTLSNVIYVELYAWKEQKRCLKNIINWYKLRIVRLLAIQLYICLKVHR